MSHTAIEGGHGHCTCVGVEKTECTSVERLGTTAKHISAVHSILIRPLHERWLLPALRVRCGGKVRYLSILARYGGKMGHRFDVGFVPKSTIVRPHNQHNRMEFWDLAGNAGENVIITLPWFFTLFLFLLFFFGCFFVFFPVYMCVFGQFPHGKIFVWVFFSYGLSSPSFLVFVLIVFRINSNGSLCGKIHGMNEENVGFYWGKCKDYLPIFFGFWLGLVCVCFFRLVFLVGLVLLISQFICYNLFFSFSVCWPREKVFLFFLCVLSLPFFLFGILCVRVFCSFCGLVSLFVCTVQTQFVTL